MKNLEKITPQEAIEIAAAAIALLIKGFENLGFRRSTKARLDALEDLSAAQEKRLQALED